MSAVDATGHGPLSRDYREALSTHEEGDHMQHGSGNSTLTQTVADIQFAGRRTGKIDWRSRPAAALHKDAAAHELAIERRIRRGLLLDGIG